MPVASTACCIWPSVKNAGSGTSGTCARSAARSATTQLDAVVGDQAEHPGARAVEQVGEPLHARFECDCVERRAGTAERAHVHRAPIRSAWPMRPATTIGSLA